MLTNFSVNTSVGFLLSLLEVFGVSQADIINWLCRLLGDEEGENGLLSTIELAVKSILLANIKNIFTCSVDPILPDNLMKYAVQEDGRQDPSANFPYDPEKPNCIEINIGAIDLFGLLANCPSNKDGGVFYFDAFSPAKETKDESGNTISYEPNYYPYELYKSRDFNAFLWYVINKGNIGSPTALQQNTWDNRNKVYKKYKNDPDLKEKFFQPVTIPSTPNVPVIKDGQTEPSLEKKQYIICQYAEHNNTYSNVLKVWLNADRYYQTNTISATIKGEEKSFKMNKTVFEFNYDYIYSLKLFDTKTLVANIVNSMLGLASSISASYSFEGNLIRKKVENIIENIITEDDTHTELNNDCYYKFDNATYQKLIDEVTASYKGSYTDITSSYNPDYTDVFDALRGISSEPTKEGQVNAIKNTIQRTFTQMVNNGSASGYAFNGTGNFSVSVDFIMEFLKQTVTQIVLQVLSPKVAILYAINSAILGDVANIEEWENFINSFENVISSIVRQVKDIIVKELYKFMMDQLKPLLELFIAKLALETIKYYKELIMNLIVNCIPIINLAKSPTTIDNVNYADILKEGDTIVKKSPDSACQS